eukprot:1391918-Amorphochlora_amoeboformis.AAC.2
MMLSSMHWRAESRTSRSTFSSSESIIVFELGELSGLEYESPISRSRSGSKTRLRLERLPPRDALALVGCLPLSLPRLRDGLKVRLSEGDSDMLSDTSAPWKFLR